MKRNRKKLFLSIAFPFWIAYLAYRATEDMLVPLSLLYYPFFTPSKTVFCFSYGLFALILGLSCYRIWISVTTFEKKRIALFGYCIQLAFVFFWHIIFVGLQEYFFAVVCGVVLCIITFENWKRFRKIDFSSGLLVLCCLAWYVFCVCLNFGVWFLN